jgi:hypothetical protein
MKYYKVSTVVFMPHCALHIPIAQEGMPYGIESLTIHCPARMCNIALYAGKDEGKSY